MAAKLCRIHSSAWIMIVILQDRFPMSFPSLVQWLHLGSVWLAQLAERLAQDIATPHHEVHCCALEKILGWIDMRCSWQIDVDFLFSLCFLVRTYSSVVYFSIFLETGVKFLQVMALLLTFCVCASLLSHGKYKRGIKSQHESGCLNILLTVLADQ